MSTRRERFERLYHDHYDRILGYALRRTGNSADAQDVVAETFLVAWRRLGDVPEGDRARMWLSPTGSRWNPAWSKIPGCSSSTRR